VSLASLSMWKACSHCGGTMLFTALCWACTQYTVTANLLLHLQRGNGEQGWLQQMCCALTCPALHAGRCGVVH
jgi:hypothetical protein